MTAALRRKISESPAARWTVLALVSFTMLTGYILSDLMAPLKTLFDAKLGWDSGDYSLFTSGYGWFNVFLVMLIFGGMILDKKGSRFTGVLAVILMIAGTFIQYWAVTTQFGDAMTTLRIQNWHIFTVKSQVLYAALGFATFGVGIELIGITATKIVVQWFKGGSVALALGLNVAAGRIGTSIALAGSFPVARAFGNSLGAPLLLALLMLLIGLLAFIVFCVLDRRYETETAADQPAEKDPEEEFRFSDIFRIARISGFWYITLLCLLFYSAVFPFLKFASELMTQKYGIDPEFAGLIPALLPFGNILLTPLFGSIYDRRGFGATIMIIGAVLLTIVHMLFALPIISSVLAVGSMLLLGVAFSLVPSAMWPSVPKIIPHRMLGTAYSVIFWIQNWGLMGVPLLIGYVLDKYCVIGTTTLDGMEATLYDYTLPMWIFFGFGALSVFVSLILKADNRRKGYGLQLPNIMKS